MSDSPDSSSEQSVEEESFEETKNDNQIIQSILSLIALSSSDNPEVDITEYKKQIKALLEQLLTKFEDDLEYQSTLEEQVKTLEAVVAARDREMRQLSDRTINDIEECKQQTEEMNSQMMGVVSAEVSKRVGLEQVLCRMQTENFKLRNLHNRNGLGAGCSPKNEIDALLTSKLKSEVGSLRKQLLTLAEENESLRLKRREELLRLQSIGINIDKFVDAVLENPCFT